MNPLRSTAVAAFLLLASACGGSAGSSAPDVTGGSTALSIGGEVSVAKGATHQFHAVLTQGGRTDDCTASAQWSSSDPAVASVAAGAATTLGVGRTTITATCSGTSATADLVVTPAEIVSLAVSPATGELPVGLQEQLVALATLSDQSTTDVTGDVVWSSSNGLAFTVSNTVGSAGVLLARNAPGQSSILTAFHAASGTRATVTRTVTSATLTSIAVDPASASVPLGLDVQFRVTGTLSDGATADVTPSAAFSATPANVVSFAAPPSTPGLATTLAAGSATISASTTTPPLTAPPATLTVTAPAIASVAIDQAGATLVAGETLQLTATATYTDDSTQAVTLGGWTSSVPGVATVSDAGVVTAVAPGLTTLGASVAAGGVTFTATTQVNVVAPTSAPVLSYLSISPGSVKGGKPVKGVVAMTAPVTADTVVTLASSSTYAVPPATVTIPAGSDRSAPFTITTTRPPTKRKVTITATVNGAKKVATLNLR